MGRLRSLRPRRDYAEAGRRRPLPALSDDGALQTNGQKRMPSGSLIAGMDIGWCWRTSLANGLHVLTSISLPGARSLVRVQLLVSPLKGGSVVRTATARF